MREWKYVVAGLSCAALLAFAPTPQVNAEVTATNVLPVGEKNANVDVDFANQTMSITVKKTGDKLDNTKLYVSFPTVKADGKISKDGTWVSYDVPDDGEVVIDLSSRKIASDFYVQVKGNKNTDPEIFRFAATEVKYKGVVDNAEAKVKLQYAAGSKKGNDLEETAELEYRTANGVWADYSADDTDLSIYQENGATVNFRVKADDKTTTAQDTKDNAAELTVATNNVATKDGDELTTYEVNGSFASNEVKVKIGKRPAGPKITVDYKKHTFTVSKGLYQIYKGIDVVKEKEATSSSVKIPVDGDGTYLWDTSQNKVVSASGGDAVEYSYISNDGAIEAWLPKDTTGKTKARSAYTSLLFDAKPTLSFEDVVESEDTKDSIDGDKTRSLYVQDNKIVDIDGKAVVTSKLAEQTTKQVNDKKHTLEITNSDTQAYEVIITDKTVTTAPKPGDKATSISKGKSKKFTVGDGQNVWIRSAADSKAKVWSSDFELLGAVPATPDAEMSAGSVGSTDKTKVIEVTFTGTVSDEMETELKKAANYSPTVSSASFDAGKLTITLSTGVTADGTITLTEAITQYMKKDAKNKIKYTVKGDETKEIDTVTFE